MLAPEQGHLRGPRARVVGHVVGRAAVDPEDHLPRHVRERRAARSVARERRARRRDRGKEATRELTKLVRSRLGLELPDDAALAKLRADHASLRARRRVPERSRAARRRRASTASRRRRRRTTRRPCASSRGGFARASPRPIRRWRIASRRSSGFATRSSRPSASARSTRSASRSARFSRTAASSLRATKFDEALALVDRARAQLLA